MMLFLTLPLYICFLAGLISRKVSAWQVDPSCSVNSASALAAGVGWDTTIQTQMGSALATHVTAATIEAQNIALYMAQKAVNGPKLDTLMQDLLGMSGTNNPAAVAVITCQLKSLSPSRWNNCSPDVI